MVMTILQATVAPENQSTLEQVYKNETRQLDRGIVQTFLLHNLKDPNTWQIATVWQSRQALDEMRNSGETPRGVLIFRAANAEPTLSVLDIAAHAMASA